VKIPFLSWSANYQKIWLRPDVIAGLTTAAVVIPKAMAYATIAGLPVVAGLYTAFVPMLIYAVLGTSRPLSVSTTTTIAILVGAQLGQFNQTTDPSMLLTVSATLAILVGIILILASLLRLGFIANFISEPVLTGFKAGIGVVIMLDQVPKLFGIHFQKGTFLHNLLSVIQHIPDTVAATLAVGVVMLLVLVGLEHYFPRLPAPLIAVAIGISGTALLGLQSYGVQTVGDIPKGLPHFITPDFSLFTQLWPGALGIALMSFTETIAAGRAFARSGEPRLQANQELLATGLANAGGALFGSMAAGGGTSQTAVNRLAGACTQLAELVTAGCTLLVMFVLAPLLKLMPDATLAAVVIVYSAGLIKPGEFLVILRIRRMEFIWAVVAFLGVILLGTLNGILVAILVSMLSIVQQTANPSVYILARKPGTNVFRPLSKKYPHDETFPGMLMIRPEGRIFFMNAQRTGEKIMAHVEKVKPTVVALDFSRVPDLEYTALKMLIEGEEKQQERGLTLWLVGLNPGVLSMVKRSALGEILGRDRMFFNLETAVTQYMSQTGSKNDSMG
jgi:sulfate permease, SulP family